MISLSCEKAISEATQYGNAILKFISPNDTGATGAHQAGFYMPKTAWDMYTLDKPERGKNSKHPIKIKWQNGLVTESVITWYGQGTRSEYRLTRFGRNFPFLLQESVGSLLILIPKSISEFSGYVLDSDEDIDEIIAALDVQPFEHWAIYKNGVVQIEDKDECLEKQFQEFAKHLRTFPSGAIFSNSTHEFLDHCFHGLAKLPADERLLEYYQTEYSLFRVVEKLLCQSDISSGFKDVNDFLKTAASIMNRRKSRAGHSLENHVDYVLKQSSVPHEMQPSIDGEPDIVIPNKEAYYDKNYPIEKLFIVGVKTTCKDRWRQVLNEARRVPQKHILTLQPGISTNQLTEMHRAGVTLIVPKKLQADYPEDHPLTILTVEDFVSKVHEQLV